MLLKKILLSKVTMLVLFSIIAVGSVLYWTRGGFDTFFIDTDFGRDLSELSNIWLGRTVWLGPHLSAGFPASPIYYYLFYPAVKLAGGDARALFVANISLAVGVLAWFSIFAWQKWGVKTLLAVGFFGLPNWWRELTIHPGNGYTYVFWFFASMTSLWFELPFFWSSLFLGLAIAYHPAAVFGLGILAYEWWQKKHRVRNVFIIGAGLALPWAQIILFEVITKAYLTRQWLAHPGNSFRFQLQLGNVEQMINAVRLPLSLLLIVLIYCFISGSSRLKAWLIISLLAVASLACLSQLPIHYLMGVIALVWFVIGVALIQKKLGVVILAVLVVILVKGAVLAEVPAAASRSIPKLEALSDAAAHSPYFTSSQKLAVVAATTPKTEVPQADDYRFFLRMKNFTVVPVTENSQADVLIMFIEVPNFDWQHWSSWEIEQFGSKKLLGVTDVGQAKVIFFSH